MVNEDIISMPDKWEYPWYAAWDLAFHTLPLSIVDPDFAKQQLHLMLRGRYLHPNGQIPAYEWNFSDVNPPVHAWATLFLHRTEQALRGEADVDFLKIGVQQAVAELHLVGEPQGPVRQERVRGRLPRPRQHRRLRPQRPAAHRRPPGAGGRHGLDGPVQPEHGRARGRAGRPRPDLRGHGHKVRRALPLYRRGHEPARAGRHVGRGGRLLLRPAAAAGRQRQRLKVRSMVGLLPLCATTVIEPWQRERVPRATAAFQARMRQMPELLKSIHPTGPGHLGVAERGIMALVNPERLRRILAKMLDENEFLSPYGIRSLSKFHEQHPYVLHVGGQEYRVDYLPAESNTGMFGGNSNWRGPVWMPVNAMIIRALLKFYLYYGDNFKIECPTGSGKMMNLFEVSKEIADRLSRIFLRDEQRPAAGLWRHGEVPVRPALARPPPVLRILPRRQRRGAGRQPPDRLDRACGQEHPALRPPGRQARPGRGQAGCIQEVRVQERANDEYLAEISCHL